MYWYLDFVLDEYIESIFISIMSKEVSIYVALWLIIIRRFDNIALSFVFA